MPAGSSAESSQLDKGTPFVRNILFLSATQFETHLHVASLTFLISSSELRPTYRLVQTVYGITIHWMELREVCRSLLFVDRRALYRVQFLNKTFLITVCCEITQNVICDTVFTKMYSVSWRRNHIQFL
jgi:hypothetical protein